MDSSKTVRDVIERKLNALILSHQGEGAKKS